MAHRKYMLDIFTATDDAVNDPWGSSLSRWRKWTLAMHETWHLPAALVLYSVCCRCGLLMRNRLNVPIATTVLVALPASRIKVRIKRDLQISVLMLELSPPTAR